ncbi:MAG: hypothetical protein ACI9OJ_003660 [Myxococcota bacterium]|jgi:hypothetical protein
MLLPETGRAYLIEYLEGTEISQRFRERSVIFTLSSRPAPHALDADATVAEMRAAMSSWSQLSCDGEPRPFDFDIVVGNEPLVAGQALDDPTNTNVLEWVSDPADWPHGEHSIGNTTLTVDLVTGEVLDVDIELNAAHHTWVLDAPGMNEYDVRNALTHEIGHVLGLDHTEVVDATIHQSVQWGETEDRSLHPDDVAGYCAVYGSSAPAWPVVEDDSGASGTCSAAPIARSLTSLFLLAITMAGLLFVGRRRGTSP